jgi:hypothetical protein
MRRQHERHAVGCPEDQEHAEDDLMPLTIFLVWPLFLLAIAIAERADRKAARKTDAARSNLAVDLDKFDRLAAAMLADDQFAETDRLWCASNHITWPAVTPAGSLPTRPATHRSRNRLHRGF